MTGEIFSLPSVRAVIVDIEGTTTDIRFVHQVLFPYARKAVRSFVRQNWQREDVSQELALVAEAAGCEASDLEGLVSALILWIDQDRKVTPLKTLQGLIWEYGFTQNEFQGHMYEDAVTQLRRWYSDGVMLSVYSSGSAFAQKLIFGYSVAGDLTPMFSQYFDTKVGHKRDPVSYQNIIAALGIQSSEALFLSDVVAELDAAKEVGLNTIQLVRSPNMETGAHPTVSSFEQISLGVWK